ncbi:hypothetical protein PCH_Pc22g08780 [Penicillium rubens Wisconsin 54-1255]|uniref:Uncharacterized protein n=1 Tax=Penicillium rubens (strain ATCC 28089 / DSM 1075 / NRRL 1951 / Wisconsin 54-1255) TaxID=500485 RepID=B6HT37_PENRW|nr:hypothetical protein PCH_Pc22g08780 [Penicillium rubens Wisconsin 54-1255]
MPSKHKHHYAVSSVFDDNLTVCSGCMTICGCPKAIELRKDGKDDPVPKGSRWLEVSVALRESSTLKVEFTLRMQKAKEEEKRSEEEVKGRMRSGEEKKEEERCWGAGRMPEEDGCDIYKAQYSVLPVHSTFKPPDGNKYRESAVPPGVSILVRTWDMGQVRVLVLVPRGVSPGALGSVMVALEELQAAFCIFKVFAKLPEALR